MRWLRRSGHGSPVVVVSGLPRSGTSLMMQMLHAGGMPTLTDNQRQADESNPKGYFEYEPVKRMGRGDVGWMRQARGKAVKIVSPLLGYLPEGYDYVVIFMRRDVGEVVASQARMIAPKPLDAQKAHAEYEAHLAQVRAWLAEQAHIHAHMVAHRDALDRPEAVAQDVAGLIDERAKIGLDVAAMSRVIDRRLYRSRST